jgi:hypothetical protein
VQTANPFPFNKSSLLFRNDQPKSTTYEERRRLGLLRHFRHVLAPLRSKKYGSVSTLSPMRMGCLLCLALARNPLQGVSAARSLEAVGIAKEREYHPQAVLGGDQPQAGTARLPDMLALCANGYRLPVAYERSGKDVFTGYVRDLIGMGTRGLQNCPQATQVLAPQ